MRSAGYRSFGVGMFRFLNFCQVWLHVRCERRMSAKRREVGKGARKFLGNLRMQDRLEAFLPELSFSRLFVEEQTQFGNEADVRDGDVIADKELAVGR